MANDLARIPKVTTLARPAARTLISARFEVQRNAFIRTAMEKFKGDTDPDASSKLAAELQPLLAEALGASDEEVSETARYLADEYLQIGDAVLIVSRETGMPLARITDDDIWQPGLVPRDNGNMATPLARLRPDLEGFLVRWTFERSREEKLVEELSKRVATTEFLAKNGDPRLYATTRAGREIIVEDLRGALPDLLPKALGGSLGQFFSAFHFAPPPEGAQVKTYQGFKAYARINTPLMDHKARNLLFDIIGSHRSLIAAQWAREIARTLSCLAHKETAVREVHFPSFTAVKGFWVASPEEASAMRSHLARYFLIPVGGAETMRIVDPPMYDTDRRSHIVLGETNIVQREVHDRWEVAATIDYDLHVDWTTMQAVRFTDLPTVEVEAQLVGE